jgi:uncharacterized protein YndB with AHSA1/START domain
MDAVERHVTLPADLDEAWDLLTRPEDLAGWLGSEVVLDPSPGAAGFVVDTDGTHRRLTVDEVDVGHRLSWRWWVDGDEGAATRVDITLTPDADGTRVTVIEMPLPGHAAPVASARASSAAAWSHRLLHLEALLLLAAAVRG